MTNRRDFFSALLGSGFQRRPKTAAHPVNPPLRGYIELVDGQLIGKFYDGTEVGRFLIGPDGFTFDGGELTLMQKDDPPKLRFATNRLSDGRGGGGAISFNVLRSDGRQEEVGYIIGSLAEDNRDGEFRGQVATRIRLGDDNILSTISTSAYMGRVWTGARNFVNGLWKFE